jgi:thiol-disulfide isomerase/thioredoxin
MVKKIALFLVSAIILAGCADKNTIKISGNLKNREHKKIYLNKIDVDNSVRIDSARIRKNGNFRFRLNASEPDFYQIGFSDSDFITILTEPGEKINLVFRGKFLYEEYDIQGSPGSEKIKILDQVLAETIRKVDSLKVIYEAASKNPDFEIKQPALKEAYAALLKEQRKKNIEFILGNLNSFSSIKALFQRIDGDTYVLYDPRDLQFLKLVSDSLNFHHPNSKQAKALKKNFEKEMNQMFLSKIAQAAKDAPEIKLDPNLVDINGKRIALSSLKGKVVLLSFWATGVEGSVSENTELKELYKLYKPKGFEIYQINLDGNETNWRNAVKFDELPWINVREDDPLNPANARLYNVRSLPANFLYDRDGTIIGTNLHGRSLQIKLIQLFGN